MGQRVAHTERDMIMLPLAIYGQVTLPCFSYSVQILTDGDVARKSIVYHVNI